MLAFVLLIAVGLIWFFGFRHDQRFEPKAATPGPTPTPLITPTPESTPKPTPSTMPSPAPTPSPYTRIDDLTQLKVGDVVWFLKGDLRELHATSDLVQYGIVMKMDLSNGSVALYDRRLGEDTTILFLDSEIRSGKYFFSRPGR
jgi:hypothetical protein